MFIESKGYIITFMKFETPMSGPDSIEPENNSTVPIVELHEIRQAELGFIADARERRIAQFSDSLMSILRK
jgi:hypothetical protein